MLSITFGAGYFYCYVSRLNNESEVVANVDSGFDLELPLEVERRAVTVEEVEAKLDCIMTNIFKACKEASDKYNLKNNYVAGANIAAFTKLADAMIEQGIV